MTRLGRAAASQDPAAVDTDVSRPLGDLITVIDADRLHPVAPRSEGVARASHTGPIRPVTQIRQTSPAPYRHLSDAIAGVGDVGGPLRPTPGNRDLIGEAHHRRGSAHQVDGYSSSMARPVWSGSISFGLVNVPVKAYTAVRDHDVHFHQLDKKSGARIRQQEGLGEVRREVEADDIEMGFEIAKGTLRHVRQGTSSPTLQPESTRSDRDHRLRRPRRDRPDLLRAHLLAGARRTTPPSRAYGLLARRHGATRSGSASARS